MTEFLKEVERITEEINEKQRELNEQAQKALTQGLKVVFGQYPFVHAIVWTQYTPYFNDGDTCVFGLGEVTIFSNESEDLEQFEESGYTWEHGPVFASKSRKEVWGNDGRKENPHYDEVWGEAQDAIVKLIHAIPESTMEQVFGDHVKVTVTAEGATVEEYDHD